MINNITFFCLGYMFCYLVIFIREEYRKYKNKD